MSKPKTKATSKNPEDFLKTIKPQQKKGDAFTLLEMFKKVTGEKAVMWGPTIVGFGKYHFKSNRSSQEGDWPMVAFSPRKQYLTLYVMADFPKRGELFNKLDKHKTTKACLYINKFTDVNLEILSEIIEKAFLQTKNTYRSSFS